MYTKDLSFLLRLLQSSRQSGILFVETAERDNKDGLEWQGRFQIENGEVKACAVLDKKSGRVVSSNEEALHWLLAKGKLEWRIEEGIQSNVIQPTFQRDEGTKDVAKGSENIYLPDIWEKHRRDIFLRTTRGSSAGVSEFPSRDHRQVFALIDGRRTVEEIVRLLQKPPESVLRLLQELQRAGFIV